LRQPQQDDQHQTPLLKSQPIQTSTWRRDGNNSADDRAQRDGIGRVRIHLPVFFTKANLTRCDNRSGPLSSPANT
jgi:hypothetical protein